MNDLVGTKARPKLKRILVPLGRFGDRIGLSPNKITIIGFAVSWLTGIFIYLSEYLTRLYRTIEIVPGFKYITSQDLRMLFLAFILISFFLSGFFDVFDGAVARYQGMVTKFGGFLDSLLDRYSDAIIIFSLIFAGYCDIYVGITAAIGSLLVSYTRARAEAGGLETKYTAIGIAERSERILILFVSIFIYGAMIFFDPNSVPNQQWGPIGWAMLILAIITQITVIQRTVSAYVNFPKNKIPITNNDDDKKDSKKEQE